MKGNAGKPTAGRKPGGEGLPYKDAKSVVGGEPQNDILGSGLGASSFGHGAKGLSSVGESHKLPAGRANAPKQTVNGIGTTGAGDNRLPAGHAEGHPKTSGKE